MLQHFWTWIAPPPPPPSPPSLPPCPFLPLFTQTWTSTRTAAKSTHYSPNNPRSTHTHTHTHTHTESTSPSPLLLHHHHLWTCNHTNALANPHGEDTSTTLLQRAGHFTEQLDERLLPSRGMKLPLNLRRAVSATSTKKSKAPPPPTQHTHTHLKHRTHTHTCPQEHTQQTCKRSHTYML